MAAITDPLALATWGIIKTGGTTDPLGLATFGVLVVDGAPPAAGGVTRTRRTRIVTIGGRSPILGR